jgi:hypothetical protein
VSRPELAAAVGALSIRTDRTSGNASGPSNVL